MSEKTKIEFSPLQTAKDGVANIALSSMAIAAAAGLLPHLGEKRALVAAESSSFVQPSEEDSSHMRRHEDHHQHAPSQSVQRVQGRSKDF